MTKTFDECVEKAIRIGRKYMNDDLKNDKLPTKEEWHLACVIYAKDNL